MGLDLDPGAKEGLMIGGTKQDTKLSKCLRARTPHENRERGFDGVEVGKRAG